MGCFLSNVRRSLRKLRSAVFVAAVCPSMHCGDLATAIRNLGFQEIIPPTTFSGPGAVIYIRDTHPLRTGVICPPEESLGPNFKPRESATQQSQFSKTRKKHFAVGADLLSQIKKEASFHTIKTITMTLSNPKIFIVADTDVLMYQHERTAVCRRAIQRRVEAKQFRISMISETLQGDVTYSVAFETGAHLSAEAKVDLLSNLKAKLKLADAEIKGNAIVGRALVWGIVDDRWLANSTMQESLAVGPTLEATPLTEISESDAEAVLGNSHHTEEP